MKLLKRILSILFYSVLIVASMFVPFIMLCDYPTEKYWGAIGNFGNYLTGVAAVYASFKAVPEWIKNQKNRQREKTEEALVVAKRFIDAIFHITNPFSFRKSDDTKSSTQQIVDERIERLKLVATDANRLFEVSSAADLYLSEDHIQIIDRLLEIWREINSSFNIYILNLEHRAVGEDVVQTWEKAFALGEIKTELEDLQKKLKSMMKKQRDIAKLE